MYGTEARDCSAPNSLQTYFRDINEVSLLSDTEERELAEAIARGDSQARSQMIQANLRLVVRIAKDYLGRGMMLEDLIGEGNLGLIRAVKDYQLSFGTRFSTYASYWIKQKIREAVINTSKTIRLPSHMFGNLNRWRQTERTLAREYGRSPTFDEVADCLGLSETQRDLIAKAKRANQLKLESSVSADDGAWSPEESPDPSEAADAALDREEQRAELLKRMRQLDDRERQVLTLRFGLTGGDPMTLKEIGLRLGITREWVRKIELRAVNRLSQDTGASGQGPTGVRTRQQRRSQPSIRRRGVTGVHPSPSSAPELVASQSDPASSGRLPLERRAS